MLSDAVIYATSVYMYIVVDGGGALSMFKSNLQTGEEKTFSIWFHKPYETHTRIKYVTFS